MSETEATIRRTPNAASCQTASDWEADMAAEYVKLGYDAFAKLLGFFGDHRQATALKRQIDTVSRELLKGDATDYVVVESELAAAKKAKDT